MKCAPGWVAILGLALAAAELQAQGIANSNPAVRSDGFSGNFPRFHHARSFILSGYYGAPYGFGFGYPYPYGFGQFTILQPYTPPPTIVVIVPRRASSADDRARDDRPPDGIIRIRPRREREKERELEKEKEKEPNPFDQPQSKPELIPPPRPKEPAKPPAPKPPPPEPPRVEPKKDPLEESARHVAIGQEAFAKGEYGRGAFRFRKAIEVAPDQPMPHFLLGQALFALGKYRDAVSAIHAGLALDPTWPTTGTRPRVLYGPNNDEYAEHLRQLETARVLHPDDPVLLFLQAYVLWFDGRKDEARPLFEKAAPLVPERKDIDRFLQAP